MHELIFGMWIFGALAIENVSTSTLNYAIKSITHFQLATPKANMKFMEIKFSIHICSTKSQLHFFCSAVILSNFSFYLLRRFDLLQNWPVSTINWIVLMGKNACVCLKTMKREVHTVLLLCSRRKVENKNKRKKKYSRFVLGFYTRYCVCENCHRTHSMEKIRSLSHHRGELDDMKGKKSHRTNKCDAASIASCLILTQPNSDLHFFPFIDNTFFLFCSSYFLRFEWCWVMFWARWLHCFVAFFDVFLIENYMKIWWIFENFKILGWNTLEKSINFGTTNISFTDEIKQLFSQ